MGPELKITKQKSTLELCRIPLLINGACRIIYKILLPKDFLIVYKKINKSVDKGDDKKAAGILKIGASKDHNFNNLFLKITPDEFSIIFTNRVFKKLNVFDVLRVLEVKPPELLNLAEDNSKFDKSYIYSKLKESYSVPIEE